MGKLKWFFTSLWVLSLALFTWGQFSAPPMYHLQEGNPWGMFIGVTILVGFVSFSLAVLFFMIDSVKSKKENKTTSHKRYDLSFKRLLSRLVLTGVIGIIFGLAMLPFMNITSENLNFQQQAAVGDQNIIRMVLLWGVFTTIVALFTFWKKRFRMVSVLLIICWLLSIALAVVLQMFESNFYGCYRRAPYETPNEINRALDLIQQRTGVDGSGQDTIWQTVFNYRNCLNIQYSEVDQQSVEGFFIYPQEHTQENLDNLQIFINPSYKNYDDLTLATLLSHELIHAGQFVNEVVAQHKLGCFEQEAAAFTAQHAFIMTLNQEEQRSIYARLREDASINPQFVILLLTGEKGEQSYQECLQLQKQANLTQEGLNACSWQGMEELLLEEIKQDPYYQMQCAANAQ